MHQLSTGTVIQPVLSQFNSWCILILFTFILRVLITITTYAPKTPFCTSVSWSWETAEAMWVNNLPKVANYWNSGATRDSNPGPRVWIPSALTTESLSLIGAFLGLTGMACCAVSVLEFVCWCDLNQVLIIRFRCWRSPRERWHATVTKSTRWQRTAEDKEAIAEDVIRGIQANG